MKELQQRSLVDWSQGASTSLFHPHLGGGLSTCRTQRYIVIYIPWGSRTLPQGCTIVSWLTLPCFCIPSLKIINYWDLFKGKHCSQAQITKWLRPKWVILCGKSHSWFSFPGHTHFLFPSHTHSYRLTVTAELSSCDGDHMAPKA